MLPNAQHALFQKAKVYKANFYIKASKVKSRHGQNCFAYRESSAWDSLPSEIKSSRAFGSFQKRLKAMLAEKL